MSEVTNVVFYVSQEDADTMLGSLQDWLVAERIGALGDLSDSRVTPERGGPRGGQNPEVRLYGAAYNYLDLATFMAHLARVSWLHLDCLQLLCVAKVSGSLPPTSWMTGRGRSSSRRLHSETLEQGTTSIVRRLPYKFPNDVVTRVAIRAGYRRDIPCCIAHTTERNCVSRCLLFISDRESPMPRHTLRRGDATGDRNGGTVATARG